MEMREIRFLSSDLDMQFFMRNSENHSLIVSHCRLVHKILIQTLEYIYLLKILQDTEVMNHQSVQIIS